MGAMAQVLKGAECCCASGPGLRRNQGGQEFYMDAIPGFPPQSKASQPIKAVRAHEATALWFALTFRGGVTVASFNNLHKSQTSPNSGSYWEINS